MSQNDEQYMAEINRLEADRDYWKGATHERQQKVEVLDKLRVEQRATIARLEAELAEAQTAAGIADRLYLERLDAKSDEIKLLRETVARLRELMCKLVELPDGLPLLTVSELEKLKAAEAAGGERE